MDKPYQVKGIMFDMDNTLLNSHIDFHAMKREIADFLIGKELLPHHFSIGEHTASTIMEQVKSMGIAKNDEEAMMHIALRHEVLGMEGAGLEPGVTELLEALTNRYILVVVTNNSRVAAVRALEETGIISYFDLIIGREQMVAMKPSPSGYLTAKQHFPRVRDGEWLSIGDSWIDGRASLEAHVPFIGYGNKHELMKEKGVVPIAHLTDIKKLLDYVQP
ncbi:HAD family hydrolase [Paenibacillus sp. SI8]|uniref:HAD family hydrolase n=1 Tax=unclassified Paenibacillus TaxID=185978 RepID=UPI003467D0FA